MFNTTNKNQLYGYFTSYLTDTLKLDENTIMELLKNFYNTNDDDNKLTFIHNEDEALLIMKEYLSDVVFITYNTGMLIDMIEYSQYLLYTKHLSLCFLQYCYDVLTERGLFKKINNVYVLEN